MSEYKMPFNAHIPNAFQAGGVVLGDRGNFGR